MAIATVRRLAADILRVGESRIRISPDNLKEIEGALTRADVKGLIGKGFITRKTLAGRASTRKRQRRRAGHTRGIVTDPKAAWMMKVRAQRRFLRMILADAALKKGAKRALYGKIKSGIFRNKRAMLIYLRDSGLVAKDYEPKKAAFAKKAAAVQGHAAAKPVGQKGVEAKPETKPSVVHEHRHEDAGASAPPPGYKPQVRSEGAKSGHSEQKKGESG